MNEAIATLKKATEETERKHFKVQCDNCTISIATEHCKNNAETIEVALRNVDDTDWIATENANMPVIMSFPLIALPAFLRQFQKLGKEDFEEVWDAWDTIACYM